MDKFKLFRDVNIKVFWIDPEDKEEKSGTLWNYLWLEAVMGINSDKTIDAKLYHWDIKGDDGKWYTFPETDLYLDSKNKIN